MHRARVGLTLIAVSFGVCLTPDSAQGGEPQTARASSTNPDWFLAMEELSPPARSSTAMAFDSTRGRVVLFGGYVGGTLSLGDTWERDGTAWVQRAPFTSPSARSSTAMAY